MSASPRRQATASRSTSTTFIVGVRKPILILRRRLFPVARNALGRGLGALIRDTEVANPVSQPPVPPPAQSAVAAAAAVAPAPAPTGGPLQVDIDLIDP